MNDSPQPTGPVLFYDGECGLCNRVVRLLMRFDRKAVLHYGPLQGPTAQAYLKEKGLPTEEFSSLVYVPSWADRQTQVPLLKTDGAKAALAVVSPFGRILSAAFGILPRVVRDGGYTLIARWRYKLFGAWTARPLPDPDWQKRLVD